MLIAQNANHILGCTNRGVGSRLRDGILPLDSAFVRPRGALHPVLGFSAQGRCGPLRASRGDHRAALSSGARLRKQGVFSLRKGRFQGDLIAAFHCLKGLKKEGEQCFTWAESDRTMGSCYNLKRERFRLALRKKFFTRGQ